MTGWLPGYKSKPGAKRVYVTNFSSHTISVIDASMNPPTVIPCANNCTVLTPSRETIIGIDGFGGIVPGGFVGPFKVAITPDGTRAYVTSYFTNTVSVIDNTATPPTVLSGPGLPIPVGSHPVGVAITHNGRYALVTNSFDDSVSVICTDLAGCGANPVNPVNSVVTTLPVGVGPVAVATTPQGQRAYVANAGSNNVSVINTHTTPPTLFTGPGFPILVGVSPQGVAIKRK